MSGEGGKGFGNTRRCIRKNKHYRKQSKSAWGMRKGPKLFLGIAWRNKERIQYRLEERVEKNVQTIAYRHMMLLHWLKVSSSQPGSAPAWKTTWIRAGSAVHSPGSTIQGMPTASEAAQEQVVPPNPLQHGGGFMGHPTHLVPGYLCPSWATKTKQTPLSW